MEEYKPQVAIAGITGSLGKHLIEAITSPLFRDHFKFPIHALTRDSERFTNTSDICYYSTGDLQNPAQMAPALYGCDVLIDATGLNVNREALYQVAYACKFKLLFPANYGINLSKSRFRYKKDNEDLLDILRERGMKIVDLKVGYFSRWNLGFPKLLGIDSESSKLIRIAGGDYPIGLTAEEDVAKMIVSLAHRPRDELPDHICCYGEISTVEKVAALYEEFKHQKLTIKDVPLEKAYHIAESIASRHGIKPLAYDEKMVLLQVIALETQNSNSGDDEIRQYVNPGLWEWKSVADIAAEVWTTPEADSVVV